MFRHGFRISPKIGDVSKQETHEEKKHCRQRESRALTDGVIVVNSLIKPLIATKDAQAAQAASPPEVPVRPQPEEGPEDAGEDQEQQCHRQLVRGEGLFNPT